MSVTAIRLEMDTEQMQKIFGMQDAYIKKLEQDFQVTIVDRNGSVMITGEEENVSKGFKEKNMDADKRLKIEERIVAMLKTVYDPEIPVDVYNLGLIYKIDLADSGELTVDMTLTAPNCPAADFIMEDVRQKIESVEGVTSATLNLVFEPEWDKDMMSEEAKLELGFL